MNDHDVIKHTLGDRFAIRCTIDPAIVHANRSYKFSNAQWCHSCSANVANISWQISCGMWPGKRYGHPHLFLPFFSIKLRIILGVSFLFSSYLILIETLRKLLIVWLDLIQNWFTLTLLMRQCMQMFRYYYWGYLVTFMVFLEVFFSM